METALYITVALVAITSFATIYFFTKWQRAEEKVLQHAKTTSEFELREKLALQSLETIKLQMENWEKTKREHMDAAKSSMLEVTTQLSNKLLADHKRETETANKEAEDKLKKATEDLQVKFQTVFEKMKSINDKVDESSKTSELIKNSLLSPQGAGKLTEITLENILKNSGLVKEIDYELQFTVSNEDGNKLRPDAIIYLPQETAIVVDCKSSKFFIDDQELQNDQNLKQTINLHLNSLISKDYRSAIEQNKKAGKILFTLMFLPSEQAVEKVRMVDGNFFDKAQKNSVIPVGYAGLINMLLQAKFYIEKDKQEQNYLLIIEEVKSLIDSVVKIYAETGSIGKNLSEALNKYNKLSDNLNKKVFGKLKKINSLGVVTNAAEELKTLPKYEFFKADETPDLKLVNEK